MDKEEQLQALLDLHNKAEQLDTNGIHNAIQKVVNEKLLEIAFDAEFSVIKISAVNKIAELLGLDKDSVGLFNNFQLSSLVKQKLKNK